MKICRKFGHQYEASKKRCPVCRAEYKRNYYEANKEQIIEYDRNYQRNRRADEPLFKLKCDIRNLINCAFKNQGFKKNTKTATILGCDFETLEAHLIQTAKNNYGGKYFPNRPYHIDHIIPVATATTEEELLKLNHYSNLQLLYPQHNRAKSDQLNWKIPRVF